MEKAGIPREQQVAIAGGNVRRLLRLDGEVPGNSSALAPGP